MIPNSADIDKLKTINRKLEELAVIRKGQLKVLEGYLRSYVKVAAKGQELSRKDKEDLIGTREAIHSLVDIVLDGAHEAGAHVMVANKIQKGEK